MTPLCKIEVTHPRRFGGLWGAASMAVLSVSILLLRGLPILCRVSSMIDNEPRITGPVLKILGALLSSGHIELSGAEISRATKLPSGTLYPILFRLERAGWLESRWEDGDPSLLGRPRRRFYTVSALGAQKARAAIKDLEPAFRRIAWA